MTEPSKHDGESSVRSRYLNIGMGSEETHEKRQSGYLVSEPTFMFVTSRMRREI
jgi:hypothetical protein